MRFLTLSVLVFFVAVAVGSPQQFHRNNRGGNSRTRLGLLGPTIGVPPVPGAGLGHLTSGSGPSFNSVSSGTPSGCFCLPPNQLCDPKGPVPFGATRINTAINTRIVNLNPLNTCPQEQRPCCFDSLGGGGGHGPVSSPLPFPIPIRDLGCGKRRSLVPGRAASDQADFGEYPWMAAILGPGNKFIAAGALIESEWILTAAHKITQSRNLVVRVGDYDLASGNEFPQFPHQEIPVAQVLIHPRYNSTTLFNDVALLRLQRPASYSESATPVCLPEKFQRFSGQRCYVSGWGQNLEGDFQPILREVDLPIIDEFECEQRLRTTRLGSSFVLNKDSFICAGGEAGKDACKGDGGSPLVCDEGGFFTVVGIVAWGIGCGQDQIPGVYVNVAFFSDFINGHVYRT